MCAFLWTDTLFLVLHAHDFARRMLAKLQRPPDDG